MDGPSSDGDFFPAADGSFFAGSFPDATVNPEDLQHTTSILLEDLEISSNASHNVFYGDLNAHDSGVDLNAQWTSPVKQGSAEPYEQFLNMGDSPMASNTPSPATEITFSQSNSPGDFIRDQSSVSSPEAAAPVFKKDPDTPEGADMWNPSYAPDAILIPQSRDAPHVSMTPDRTKTRAETQIKMTLTIDPLDNVEHIRFPRKALAKPKHFASEEERQEIEQKGGVLQMDVHLVCATAIENAQDRERALRRAAGTEEIPRRPEGVTITELDKDDPSHPQNGGQVLICDGCKERERKRYDRKKKRGEDEEEYLTYESDRVIMINEKEHRKFKEVDGGEAHFSPRARQVEFAMRITCYCRHQEEKSPMGYRVIFTFTLGKTMLVQHISDVFHITDDHKNKEPSADGLPHPLTIPQGYGLHQYHHQQSNVVVPMYQFPENYGMNAYSQPTTPIVASQFTSPISPMDTSFGQGISQSMPPAMAQTMPQSMSQSMSQSMPQSLPQSMPHSMAQQMTQPMTTLAQQARHPPAAYQTAGPANAPAYARHQRGHSYFDTPMLSPTSQMGFGESHGLPRPQSMDNFNFNPPWMANSADFPQYFSSAPPSAGGTPINLSRPASPTWEQGPNKKGKTLRCVYFYVDE
ncbi:SPT3 Dosage dependent suppressor of Ty-induced promoter mutations-like protein [Didymosphaeria variabile]|uniref:SPT3 Dosage dependent suppressor of Ty-induced promoter mutations-like protein n=1 Tax=Didymosphaeria variabile TaxID=1932322 RepID=A0A9W8XDB6_9PLEO|nr:SPT3 Dosage dependent suppressor of Ty-induced promoter mutations-like protein [Didymosphaeria variabile]KAJ4347807.1 SPT3 Dosage dependent suppressor of Ty-induced promoter mutations-like protein [Didymosphaeria variabile]